MSSSREPTSFDENALEVAKSVDSLPNDVEDCDCMDRIGVGALLTELESRGCEDDVVLFKCACIFSLSTSSVGIPTFKSLRKNRLALDCAIAGSWWCLCER